MEAKLKGDVLTIAITLKDEPVLSQSGNNWIIAQGDKRWETTKATFEGKPITISLAAIVPVKAPKESKPVKGKLGGVQDVQIEDLGKLTKKDLIAVLTASLKAS